MAKKKLFGNEIKPRCEYCTHGKINSTGDKVGCDKKGLVNADYSCKMFTYSPLKRVPSKQLTMSAQAAEAAAAKMAKAEAKVAEATEEVAEVTEKVEEAVEVSEKETEDESAE